MFIKYIIALFIELLILSSSSCIPRQHNSQKKIMNQTTATAEEKTKSCSEATDNSKKEIINQAAPTAEEKTTRSYSINSDTQVSKLGTSGHTESSASNPLTQSQVESIKASEMQLMKELQSNVEVSYNETMRELLARGVYPPNDLNEIHSTSVSKFTDGYKVAFLQTAQKYTPEVQLIINQCLKDNIEPLARRLDACFEIHKQTNDNNKLKKLSNMAKDLRSEYNRVMIFKLKKEPYGIEPKIFKAMHNDLVQQYKQKLNKELLNLHLVEPPLDTFIWKFENGIKADAEDFSRSNQKNLTKKLN